MELCLDVPHHLLKDDLGNLEPVDALYLGEVYCPVKEPPINEIADLSQKIKARGKRVYLSTPVLATNSKALSRIRDYFRMAREGLIDGVSLNDPGALRIGASEYPGVRLYGGPYLEVRNAACAKVLANLGVERFCLPYDLLKEEIKEIVREVKAEVFVQGKIPLLVSRCCFLMRAKGMAEDSPCHTLCLDRFKEGMKIAPCGSDKILFELKGRVVYSAKEYSLWDHLDQLKELGVAAIRVEENEQLRPEIYQAYRNALNGKPNPQPRFRNPQSVNGFFFGQAGLECVGEDRARSTEHGARSTKAILQSAIPGTHEVGAQSTIKKGRFFEELSSLARKVGHSQKLREKLEGIDGDVFFEVTDTGERCSLGVRQGRPYGPIAGEPEKPPVLRVRAKEDVYLKIIQGKLDPDAAYLLRKIKFKGPFLAAVKLKHILGAI
ncbi:U32 family peptidase [bacterium]|nr:U32 family peptidase [bacterium]